MKNERGVIRGAAVLLEIHGNDTKTLVNIMFPAIYMISMPMGHHSFTLE